MIKKFESLLEDTLPFVRLMSLIFGFIAAVLALIELVPIVGQVWTPAGDMVRIATVAAALALVCLAIKGKT